ncbi:anti-sigma factor domain-containing protein [Xanthobacter pseudotagetidis]|uniref:anti-sigma factor domain-containing protein n=1 Tax=Xanthobacter pseudotagetidis TaxID=3119911 RepID=UPI003728BC5C
MPHPASVRPKASDQDRALAAEYVVGTLDGAEREAVRQRLRADAAFAGLVRKWERRLAPLHELSVPVAPPPALLGTILAALPPQRVKDAAPGHEGAPPSPDRPRAAPRSPAPWATARPAAFPPPAPALPGAARQSGSRPPSVAVMSASGSRAAVAAVPAPPTQADRTETLRAMSETIASEWEGLLAGLDQLEAEIRGQLPEPEASPDVPGATAELAAAPLVRLVAPSSAAPAEFPADAPPEPLRAARIGLLGRIAGRWGRAAPAAPEPPPPPASDLAAGGPEATEEARPATEPRGSIAAVLAPAVVDAAPEGDVPAVPSSSEPSAAEASASVVPPDESAPMPLAAALSGCADASGAEPAAADPPHPPGAELSLAEIQPPDPGAAAPQLQPATPALDTPGDASAPSVSEPALPLELEPQAGAAVSEVAAFAAPTPSAPPDRARRSVSETGLWRAVAAIFAIFAIGLGGLTAYRQWIWPRNGDYVAVLQPQSTPAVVVRVDPESGVLFVRAFAPPPPEGMAYQLWLRPKGERAVPLGHFSSGLAVRAPELGAADRSMLRAATVAVTLEPARGAGAGDAPGMVVFEGRLVPE